MDQFNPMPAIAELETRNEMIAMAQLIALHLDQSLFQSDEPLVIILNGSGSSGKSLLASAFGAQLGEIRTSSLSIIGETTWESARGVEPANLRLHFIDAAEVCENPLELLRGHDGLPKDPTAFKKELKQKGDVIFLQNVPEDFRDIADMEMVVTVNSPTTEDWKRLATIMVHNPRVMKGDFPEFFDDFGTHDIKEAAVKLPDNYLMPDGEIYGPILE